MLFGTGVGAEPAGGGFEVGAAEEFLDGADVNSVADEIGCEGVAESVRGDAFVGEAGCVIA